MSREPENLVDLLSEDAPSERMRARLRQDIGTERRRGQRRRVRQRWTWAVAALVLLAAGLGVGRRWLGHDPEPTKIRELLASDSALRRAQGARATTELTTLPAPLRTRLESLLRTDPDANVRLAAMFALTARGSEASTHDVLIEAVVAEWLPIVQAHLVRSLQQNDHALSPDELERLRALDHLDEAARRRLPES